MWKKDLEKWLENYLVRICKGKKNVWNSPWQFDELAKHVESPGKKTITLVLWFLLCFLLGSSSNPKRIPQAGDWHCLHAARWNTGENLTGQCLISSPCINLLWQWCICVYLLCP